MKQATFDNFIKLAALVILGYFVFNYSRTERPNGEGRFISVDAVDESLILVLDTKTGLLYKGESRLGK